MGSINKVINPFLNQLKPRQKEVVVSRFGLDSKEPQTLAAIGDRFGITRERVRQIEAAALKILENKIKVSSEPTGLLDKKRRFLESQGGIVLAEALLNSSPAVDQNLINFLITLKPDFHFYEEDGNYHPLYYSDKNKMRAFAQIVSGCKKLFNSQKMNILAAGPSGANLVIKKFAVQEKIQEAALRNYLAISRGFYLNSLSEFGLTEWPEINPQTARQRAYIVLKKAKQPLHFTEIAKRINEFKLGGRIALATTIHNELIKDSRFVLVGRGMYGLTEEGYRPGTAQEVIARILKKFGPLHQDKVIQLVNQERILKPNTIVLNLRSQNAFERLENGNYRLRES